MEENNAQVVQISGVAELVMRSPETVLAEAEMVAKALAKQAQKLGLYKQIGQSKHLRIEGWQMVGAMFRVTARITETRFLDYGQVRGYEAVAESYHIPTGQIIGRAEGMCLSDEDNWGLRPKYEKGENGERGAKVLAPVPLQQLRSMAQTRACSKVLSNAFKWIATMGGFAGTPAEEMTGDEYDGDGKAIQQPQRKSAGAVISEAQSKRFYAIAKGSGKSDDEIKAFLKHCGFEKSTEITRDRYEQICELVKQPTQQHSSGLEKPATETIRAAAAGPQPIPEEMF